MASLHRRRAAVCLVLMSAAALAGCGTAVPEPAGSTPAAAVSVALNQSRDQYGTQAILLELTNNTTEELSVTGARVESPLFQGSISWTSANTPLALPPGQPKALPAVLPGPACGDVDTATPVATVHYSVNGQDREVAADAHDPFGILARTSGELCLAAEAAGVAAFSLDPGLEHAADGRTAVVRLLVTPTGLEGSQKSLTIESIDGTTLLAEAVEGAWPRNVTIEAGGDATELRLPMRAARCDPHAVAEDKVGTLLPVRVAVGERRGILKVAAPSGLRGSLYDFVAKACSG